MKQQKTIEKDFMSPQERLDFSEEERAKRINNLIYNSIEVVGGVIKSLDSYRDNLSIILEAKDNDLKFISHCKRLFLFYNSPFYIIFKAV